MLEADANNPELQEQKRRQGTVISGEGRIEEMERMKLLYGVPNVPYREIEKK